MKPFDDEDVTAALVNFRAIRHEHARAIRNSVTADTEFLHTIEEGADIDQAAFVTEIAGVTLAITSSHLASAALRLATLLDDKAGPILERRRRGSVHKWV